MFPPKLRKLKKKKMPQKKKNETNNQSFAMWMERRDQKHSGEKH
jgi:hypothetical protein